MLATAPFSPFRVLLIPGLLAQGWVAGAATTAAIPNPPPAKSQPQAVANYGNLPLSFEANQGQADPSVKFLSRGSGYSLFLTSDGAVLALGQSRPNLTGCASSQRRNRVPSNANPAVKSNPCPEKSTAAQDIVRMTLAGAASQGHATQASGEDQLPGKVNYFIGNDPTRWRTSLPTYAKVRYSSVYPGVDLIYYGNQRQLEYDFVVAPGVNAASIQLHFAGARHLRIAANGDLVLKGAHGEASFRRPVIYQEEDGGRKAIAGNFRMVAGNTVGFSLGSYDHTRPLVIDPVLVYSTYLGGSGSIAFLYYYGDRGNGIAADTNGNAYVVGSTVSANFPVTPGAYQTKNKAASPSFTNSASNVFVSKFNSAGTALIYSTYLGGSGQFDYTGNGDSGAAIALDAENNAYVTGTTYSLDFPVTAGAFQTVDGDTYNNGIGTFTQPIAFVTKLNSQGNRLVYSTYLGGITGSGGGAAIAIDTLGDAFVAGSTNANDFPVTAGAFQTLYPAASAGADNAFVSELNPDGAALVYSTYLGGTGATVPSNLPYSAGGVYGDSATGIAIDSLGNAYVTGSTYSADFPVTSGAFQTKNHGFASQNSNAFVTKLNSTGTDQVYSTFLGGSGHTFVSYNPAYPGDLANAISIDSDGNVYVAGVTGSTDFPIDGGLLQTLTPGDQTGFVTKLNAAGSGLEYSTFVGENFAQAKGLAVDSSGVAYVSGLAPYLTGTPGALTQNGGVFVAKLNAAATALNYATSLGGYPDTGPTPLALDSAGNVYITGSDSTSGYLISSGAFQTVNKAAANGATNAFVTKLALAEETTDYFPVQVSISASVVSLNPASVASLNQGQPLTLTIKVTGSPAAGLPTGQVTIMGVSQPNPVITLDASGAATWTSSSLAPGLYEPYATYPGDATHLASGIPNPIAKFRVIGPPASIANAGFNYHYVYGEFSNLALSALVTDSSGYPLQRVTVNFAGAGLTFSPASAITNANGIATVDFTAYKAGLPLIAMASVTGIASPLEIPIDISPAPLKVTLHGSWRYYGAANPTFTYIVAGLIGSDTVTVTPQTTATAASPVGNYPVTAVVSGPDAANYATTIVNSILEVGKAPLHVQARSAQSVYGHAPPPLVPYFEGFVNGDTAATAFTGAPVLTTTVTAATPVGVYKIGVQIGTLASTNYYFCLYGNGEGSVYVGKVTLEAVPNDLTMTQGGPVPPLTYTVTGFVNGDTAASSLTGAPVLTTTATSSSPKGHYPIFLARGTLVGENYFVQAGNGVMTVVP